MAKTLVIAEKPSVGRDLSRVLPGPWAKHEGYLEGPEHVLTWAVGHLFKLVVRDERSKKQMSVVTQELKRDDVDTVVNACDAGREGELIFAYLYEKAGSKKPVQRLWLSSMTKSAMTSAFENLRPSEEGHGSWECHACLRAFTLKMLGMIARPDHSQEAPR